ncbi:MAG: gluconate 2-dehydrogenase subunit 3 family protein [Pedosphaera sp.]|nr:gluconate 2-dehydrogenase subunit 3 family protein [Pedosphaera sp.]
MSEHDQNEPKRMDRREALKWVGAALLAYPMLEWTSFGAAVPGIKRTLSDPDLLHPGKLWDRTLTKPQLRTTAALCDVIIPEDEKSPAASKLGIPDFIDEWVSAPYPIQQEDQKQIIEGLAWLDTEANKRFQKGFADLKDEEKCKICDDICFAPKAKPEFLTAANFFAKMRDLTATGFYTTKEGMKDLQYIGNTPLLVFKGPPKEVLEHLKLK